MIHPHAIIWKQIECLSTKETIWKFIHIIIFLHPVLDWDVSFNSCSVHVFRNIATNLMNSTLVDSFRTAEVKQAQTTHTHIWSSHTQRSDLTSTLKISLLVQADTSHLSQRLVVLPFENFVPNVDWKYHWHQFLDLNSDKITGRIKSVGFTFTLKLHYVKVGLSWRIDTTHVHALNIHE